MQSFIQKRLCRNPLDNPIIRACLSNSSFSSFSHHQFHYSSTPAYNHTAPRCASFAQNNYGLFLFRSNFMRFLSSEAACAEASTSDGLTVEGIIANNWVIYDENLSDWKSHAAAIAQSIHLIKKRLRWKTLKQKLEMLTEELNKPDLWDDPKHAGKISREHGSIMGKMKEVNSFEKELIEQIDMIKLASELSDAESESESFNALLELRRQVKEKEIEALLAGEHDPCSCFIQVQAGAGGTDAMDWASMLMQMYRKWAERRHFRVTTVEEIPGEIAGVKKASLKVEGDYAYGYAKAEVGAHRLVRISKFDPCKQRHTSVVSVAVIPIIGGDFSHVKIKENDLRVERYRSGGPGGQHANTTDSAVRITHVPTGITASSQNQRSQHQNRASAMAVLQSRLDQLEIYRQAQVNSEHTQSLTDAGFGSESQIRSYVVHPYRMVKDVRNGYEVTDLDSVLEGDIDCFIFNSLSASLDKHLDD